MSRKEIDPILKQKLEELRTIPPRDPVRSARGKAEFLKQAAGMHLTASQEKENRNTKGRHTFFPAIPGREHAPVFNPLIAIVLAIAILFGGAATTVYASQSSLPDQVLYPVKILSEDATLALYTRPETQIEYYLAFSDRRIAEMTQLLSKGSVIPEEVMNRLQNELDQSLHLAAELDDLQMRQQLEKIRQRAEIQLQETNRLMPAAPQADQALLLRVQARIQEQMHLAILGDTDPEEYRRQVQRRLQFHGGAGEATPGTGGGPDGSSRTPVPDGNGNGPVGGITPTPTQHEPKTDGSQPTKTPEQSGTASRCPTLPPQNGGGNPGGNKP